MPKHNTASKGRLNVGKRKVDSLGTLGLQERHGYEFPGCPYHLSYIANKALQKSESPKRQKADQNEKTKKEKQKV